VNAIEFYIYNSLLKAENSLIGCRVVHESYTNLLSGQYRAGGFSQRFDFMEEQLSYHDDTGL
jgi:hypothetical protein